MSEIKKILMKRDGMSEAEASNLIKEATEDLNTRLLDSDPSAEDICSEYFGLEPDYLMELL
jgi:hypothetical protein